MITDGNFPSIGSTVCSYGRTRSRRKDRICGNGRENRDLTNDAAQSAEHQPTLAQCSGRFRKSTIAQLTHKSRSGYDIRNSSIRAKPKNQERLDRNEIPERTLKRLLRMKIAWASTVVVLVGKDTHSRSWVNWEIERANQLGKRIVGVFAQGGTKADIPPAFEKYGSSLVAWNTESIVAAIDGTDNPFQNPDGSVRESLSPRETSVC